MVGSVRPYVYRADLTEPFLLDMKGNSTIVTPRDLPDH